MGLKMLYSSPNSSILLGGPVGPRLADMLDARIRVPTSVRQPEDQYHLIMEYRDGDKWGSDVSKCSNRFILTRDSSNSRMTSMEPFFESLVSFKPDLVVLSGLHLLESENGEFREARLNDLARFVKLIDRNVPIHLELASMADKNFFQSLVTTLFPLVDSVGLNEQELSFLTVALDGPHRTDGDLRQWPPEIGMSDELVYFFVHPSFGWHFSVSMPTFKHDNTIGQ